MNSNQNSVLIAGESWITVKHHLKGIDSFTTTSYGEGVKWVKAAIEEAGFFVEHLPNHDAGIKFPQTVEDLNKYAVVILSDIGSNTLLLHPEPFHGHKALPNRLEVLKKYVADGGALVMAGGYFSFQGIEAKANYRNTVLQDVLPVLMSDIDDRVEVPQGINPVVVDENHPVMKGLSKEWPIVLGYNRFTAKDDSQVLMSCGDDPFVVMGTLGQGRTMAFATDVGPHWASPELVDAKIFADFWAQSMYWLTKKI